MCRIYSYSVAGVAFGIDIPSDSDADALLKQYSPFLISSEENNSFCLKVIFDEGFEQRLSGHNFRKFNQQAPFLWLDVEGEDFLGGGFSIDGSASECVLERMDAGASACKAGDDSERTNGVTSGRTGCGSGQKTGGSEQTGDYDSWQTGDGGSCQKTGDSGQKTGDSWQTGDGDSCQKTGGSEQTGDGDVFALYVRPKTPLKHLSFLLNNCMMMLFTGFSAASGILNIHASVVVKDGKGYAFLGKSGTGKSTHSKLWMKNIEGVSLLNDDNPVLRNKDGIIHVCGTPWSGKTPCYVNEEYPLGGLVRLSQAPFNKIGRLSGVMAYAALLPSCSCLKWSRRQSDLVSNAVTGVISKVPLWHLDCLPDDDAALLSYKNISL